jgi:hypothetical protein
MADYYTWWKICLIRKADNENLRQGERLLFWRWRRAQTKIQTHLINKECEAQVVGGRAIGFGFVLGFRVLGFGVFELRILRRFGEHSGTVVNIQ